jgi:hypothetical protein
MVSVSGNISQIHRLFVALCNILISSFGSPYSSTCAMFIVDPRTTMNKS